MVSPLTGSEIRKSFINFFIGKGHTFVPSASLVPGGDQTLLFTNAGMVQFKDVFLGTDQRPYKRAVNSQKCMRVAGKQNDLDDVGRDNTHHTFFEMLGNWSFGDYYKKEAIEWAWELLTEVWKLDRKALWTTCFQDEKGQIPADEEAAKYWAQQKGINPDHILYFGRKDNFWEMADTGPCGPCSEIHLDRGLEYCDKKGTPGHVCKVNGDCTRFLELWNLVFMQYNRISETQLDPLPAKHVDTGMGLERIVSVLQNVNSNYLTDLLSPVMEEIRSLTGETLDAMEQKLTPYRVVADHARTASFLISDGVVPGNTGRNYICRMIIRRAARFGTKLGLNDPFLSKVAEKVIQNYADAYPELLNNKKTILDEIKREEIRFQDTVEAGMTELNRMIVEMKNQSEKTLSGKLAFDLYATHGLPLEITRDILREQGYEVDEKSYSEAMEDHRVESGKGKSFASQDGKNIEVYKKIFQKLIDSKELNLSGVVYNPYDKVEMRGKILALVKSGISQHSVEADNEVEVVLPETCFYVESGGQVSDEGVIISAGNQWEIQVSGVKKPAAGIIVHIGKVIHGTVHVGDPAIGKIDIRRRNDIRRNHTATHLLHAQLHKILGEHARQAGSLVAPDKLRFDFNNPEAISQLDLLKIEAGVNQAIYEDTPLTIKVKTLQEAKTEGAMALFGEKYGETVRTVGIGEDHSISYELCGGTHVDSTGDIGMFLITSETSAAAGIRRIEAVTGRGAYSLVKHKFSILQNICQALSSSLDDIPIKVNALVENNTDARKEINRLTMQLGNASFSKQLESVELVGEIPVLATTIPEADIEILRQMTDEFRGKYPSGIIVLGSISQGKPLIIAVVSDDLLKKGLDAIKIIKEIGPAIGGGGGGKPSMAQAGGKNPDGLSSAIEKVIPTIKKLMN